MLVPETASKRRAMEHAGKTFQKYESNPLQDQNRQVCTESKVNLYGLVKGAKADWHSVRLPLVRGWPGRSYHLLGIEG
jgi:hypothetical protein